MSFSFYRKHEHGCRELRHCPHLGGAPLGLVVLAANENQASRDHLLRQLDAERKTVSQLVAEVEALKRQLAQAKQELKLERQTKFATNQQKQADSPSGSFVPRGQPGEGQETQTRRSGRPSRLISPHVDPT